MTIASLKSWKQKQTQINRIAKKVAQRKVKRDEKNNVFYKPLSRKATKPRQKGIIAYDLETTSIKAGTPRPLYITAFGDDGAFRISQEIKHNLQGRESIDAIEHLAHILTTYFLIPEHNKKRFVAWNGNKYDVYFIAAALLQDDRFILRPYLTRTKNLRGLKVSLKSDEKQQWEFLDGIAMTVGSPRSLKDFLKVFAPDYQKLEAPDFEHQQFNPRNNEHVRYAERDSEGLYYAIKNVEQIVQGHFSQSLQATIGNMGIKIFQAHMPKSTTVYQPPTVALQKIRDFVMRGGYCFCARKYQGPVWKYDINQAYASAMREAKLPSGRCIHSLHPAQLYKSAKAGVFQIEATNPKNRVPFYYRDQFKKSVFALTEIADTWLTNIEINQLEKEGWNVTIKDGYFWEESFSMNEYVNKLENLRVNAPGGPKSAQGEVMKSIGNNSYGKTVETLDGIELLLAKECPDGFAEYPVEENELLSHVWFRFNEPMLREYHQPQIGAFITAHVRMVVRRAALLAPDNWLYADTDCVIFDKDVSNKLDIDGKRYGAWKIESEGDEYRIITKKVYATFDAKEKHAKGLNVKRLSEQDFIDWYNGKPPQQTQVHRQNFIKVMSGADFFVERVKVGQRMMKESLP